MTHFSLLRGAVIAAMAVATSTAMHADTIKTVGVHIGSVHLPAQDFNNANPGLYLRTESGLTAGAYYNSERRMSAYAGYTQEWGPVGVTVGVITGYKRAAVLPMLVPSVRLGRIDQVTFRLAYLPKLEKGGSHVVHLMAEF